jgi:8-oxo-dGTP diphosphatase
MYCNCRAIIERKMEGGIEILVQMRNKPYEGSTLIELPGGRVEEFESLMDVLRREVREETGLDVWYIEGQDTRIETNGVDTNVECIRPYAAYQTLHGPVDSMGIYFRCLAQGQLLDAGDEARHPSWMALSEIARFLKDAPERFSFVDRAGLAFYIKNIQ